MSNIGGEAGGRQRLGGLFPLFAAVLVLVFSNRRWPMVTSEKFYVVSAVILVLILFSAPIWRLHNTPQPLIWLAGFALICLVNFLNARTYGVPTIEWARHAAGGGLCRHGHVLGSQRRGDRGCDLRRDSR